MLPYEDGSGAGGHKAVGDEGQETKPGRAMQCQTHGAMMTLAPDIGRELSSKASGTRLRYSSSSEERMSLSPLYQLYAWVASRVPEVEAAMSAISRQRIRQLWF